ncbi:VanZ family protein [Actinacidiphila rubida]|uniref:VanZ like family protein n=1 Tax=Actinacidiphila rubida TaxID=310780 RepID=A0A1H8NGZ9_9ACTN|nr:VanZ family protein [Actinacidiphila rubida]SEO28836.1 VanZ like family protein [Actinacidiphila rubida]
MDHTASPSARRSRARTAVLAVPAVLVLTLAAFVLQRPLTASGARQHDATGVADATGTRGATGAHAWLGTFNGVAFLTLAALPLAALVVWALARSRSGIGTTLAWQRSLAEVGMVYGTVPWVWMTMLPGGEAGAAPRRVNLVPLRDLISIIAAGPGTATVQIVGNLLVFAALGFFAPLRFAHLASLPRILALGAACSTLVETAQYVLSLDRVSSVDDVLVNATGAGLAALASRRWWHPTASKPLDTSACPDRRRHRTNERT